jgi:polyisoprenoid-binding protein YceI
VSEALLATLVLAATYSVEPARCSVAIHVGRSGLFKFAGHAHEVVASRCDGEVVAVPEDLGRSSVQLSFDAASLRVSEKGEPEGDAPKVQEAMLGPKLLDAARFPGISFVSTAVSGRLVSAGVYELVLTGDLGLHGVTRRISLPLRVVLQADSLTASGHLDLKQTAFGLSPISVAGLVKVKDEIGIDFEIAARRRAR